MSRLGRFKKPAARATRCSACRVPFIGKKCPCSREASSREASSREASSREASSREAQSEFYYRQAILDAVELLEAFPNGFTIHDFHRGNHAARLAHMKRLRERLGVSWIYDRVKHIYLWSPVDTKRIRQLEAALLRSVEENDDD